MQVTSFEANEGRYCELINAVLDAITFTDNSAKEKFITAASDISISKLKNIPELEDLVDLLDPSMGYYYSPREGKEEYPDHTEQFSSLALRLLQNKVKCLKEIDICEDHIDSEVDKGSKIQAQSMLVEEREFLSQEQLEDIRKFNEENETLSISYALQKPEAEICIAAAKLLARVNEYIRADECNKNQVRETKSELASESVKTVLVEEYIQLMAGLLKFNVAQSTGMVKNNSIKHIHNVLYNILIVFNSSYLKYSEFKQFSVDKRKFLIRQASTTLFARDECINYAHTLDPELFQLYLDVAFYRDAVHYAKKDDQLYIPFIRAKVERFLKSTFNFKLNDIEEMHTVLSIIESVFTGILGRFSLDWEIFEGATVNRLEMMGSNTNSIKKLSTITENGIGELLDLPQGLLAKFFEHTDLIIQFANTTGMRLSDLLGFSHNQLNVLLSDPIYISRLAVLLKRYFLKISDLQALNTSDLSEVLMDPTLSIKIFSRRSKKYSGSVLVKIVAAFEEKQLDRLSRLGNQEYVLNVGEIWSNVHDLINELSALGLEYSKISAVSDTVHSLTIKFVDIYFQGYMNPLIENTFDCDTRFNLIKSSFNPWIASSIIDSLDRLRKTMQELLDDQILEQQDVDFADAYEFIAALKENQDFKSFSKVYDELYKKLSPLEPNQIRLAHLRLLRAFLLCKIPGGVKSEDIQLRLIDPLFQKLADGNLALYTKWYMSPSCADGEQADIFAAIEQQKTVQLLKCLNDGQKPLLHNSKQYSVLACALISENQRIIGHVKRAILHDTADELSKFITGHRFKDIYTPKNGVTPLQFAIGEGNLNIVQALLVRDVIPTSEDLGYAKDSKKQLSTVILHDLATALAHRSRLFTLDPVQGQPKTVTFIV